jgi:malate synthase
MPMQDLFQNNKLTESETEIINEACYYAVREIHNSRIENKKDKLMRQALDLMKKIDQVPNSPYVVKISLDSFLDSCVARGWEKELKEIKWLMVD